MAPLSSPTGCFPSFVAPTSSSRRTALCSHNGAAKNGGWESMGSWRHLSHREARGHIARLAIAVSSGVLSRFVECHHRPLRRSLWLATTLHGDGGGTQGVCGGAASWVARRLGLLTWSLGLVWLALFCDYVLMTMAIPIFPLLGVSSIATGALFSAKAACQIVFSPFLARFVDKHEKMMIMSGLSAQALSILIFATSFNYKLWFTARAVSGISSAAIVAAGFAHLQRRYQEPETRAVAMGLATTGIIGGVCFGPVLGGVLYEASPKLPFALLALLVLSTATLSACCLPTLEVVASPASAEVPVRSMLKRHQTLFPLGALIVANAAISCLESTVASYASAAFGFTTAKIGALFLFVSVPSCIMSGFAGPIGNKIGQAALVCIGLLVQGGFTMLGPKSSFTVEVVSLLGLGAGMGMIDGAAPALLGSVADKYFQGSGKIFVLSNMAVQFGFVIGPVLGNILVERCGFGVCCLATGSVLIAYAPLLGKLTDKTDS